MLLIHLLQPPSETLNHSLQPPIFRTLPFINTPDPRTDPDEAIRILIVRQRPSIGGTLAVCRTIEIVDFFRDERRLWSLVSVIEEKDLQFASKLNSNRESGSVEQPRTDNLNMTYVLQFLTFIPTVLWLSATLCLG